MKEEDLQIVLEAPDSLPEEPGPGAAEDDSEILEEVLARTPPRPAGEVTIGRLAALGEGGEPLVTFPDSPSRRPLPARATLALGSQEVGREVALLFEAGDPSRPVVMGLLRPAAAAAAAPGPRRQAEAKVDGERLTFEAGREIVLRCGQASITLTRAGKIILRGKYLLSRSSGVNRIKGGSVQIN